jgi:Rrf2 family protein
MKIITRDTDYAIRACVYMAKNRERIVSAQELVRQLGIPHAFIRGLLQTLSKEDILKSLKGKGGGFQLARKPEKLRIVDIMQAVHRDNSFVDCRLGKKECHNYKCSLRKKLKAIEAKVLAELATVTISQMIRGVA